MDSGVALRRSCRLAGLPPYHIDSHTMGDHEYEITELSSPPQEVGEEDPTPIYDPSPDIPTHSGSDPSHDIPTHSRYDPSYTGHRYWILGDKTHHEPVSTSYVSCEMSGILAHDSVPHTKSEFEPNTMPGGIPRHFHVERFGNTSHIAPSIPTVEATSHVHPRPGVSSPIRIPEPRQVTIGNTTYIVSRVPSSSIPSSSNSIPPPHSRGPSGRNVATSHVRIAATRIIVS